MTEIFTEDEEELIEVSDDFEEADVELDSEVPPTFNQGLDARRRLEQMLEEKRLQDELDDFGDY